MLLSATAAPPDSSEGRPCALELAHARLRRDPHVEEGRTRAAAQGAWGHRLALGMRALDGEQQGLGFQVVCDKGGRGQERRGAERRGQCSVVQRPGSELKPGRVHAQGRGANYRGREGLVKYIRNKGHAPVPPPMEMALFGASAVMVSQSEVTARLPTSAAAQASGELHPGPVPVSRAKGRPWALRRADGAIRVRSEEMWRRTHVDEGVGAEGEAAEALPALVLHLRLGDFATLTTCTGTIESPKVSESASKLVSTLFRLDLTAFMEQDAARVLSKETPKDAVSTKNAFQYHIRFLWLCLFSNQAPVSASSEVVKAFDARFAGLTVAQLKKTDDESGESLGTEDSADDESDDAMSEDEDFIDDEGAEGTGADEDEWQEDGNEGAMNTDDETDVGARNQAAFAAEYGYDMQDVEDVQTVAGDLEKEIFGGSESEDE
ncbi:hypothetical protein B0H10DRAFT_1946354 [Mycena sp. CBHHK59/15]|nr:hypothetical protein B0H10DRAFT_1946354 [Mycena sp. CBHHK59/15]